jgi:hypothetical protein
MGWVASSGIRCSIAKVAVMIAIPAVIILVPAYPAPGFGGTAKTPTLLDNRIRLDNPTCGLDPANVEFLVPVR